MNRRAFSRSASLLSAAREISSNDRAPKVDHAAFKHFKEILGYADEQFNRLLQNPLKQKELLQMGDIAQKHLLFEVLKKTL